MTTFEVGALGLCLAKSVGVSTCSNVDVESVFVGLTLSPLNVPFKVRVGR